MNSPDDNQSSALDGNISNSSEGYFTAIPAEGIPINLSHAFKSYSANRKYTLYSLASDIIQGETLATLPDVVLDNSGKECFWLDVSRPSNDDLIALFHRFRIHPLTLEDIQLLDNREKCEIFEEYLFMCVRTCNDIRNRADQASLGPVSGGFGLAGETGDSEAGIRKLSLATVGSTYPPFATVDTGTLYILLYKNFLLTIHHEESPHIRRVLRKMYSLRKGVKLTADWIAYWLLDEVVDEFGPSILALQEEIDRIDEVVLFLSGRADTGHDQTWMLRHIGTARKRVTCLIRLLKPKTDILRLLTKRTPGFMRPHTVIYLRDVNDHVLTDLQNLDQYTETLNRSHNNYLAQISIELNEASNRMNQVMKTLTGVAALLLPLNLISGVWGMNVPVPGQAGVDSFSQLVPFFSIILIMMILTAGLFFFGSRRDWW